MARAHYRSVRLVTTQQECHWSAGTGFNWNLGIASVQPRTRHSKVPTLCEH